MSQRAGGTLTSLRAGRWASGCLGLLCFMHRCVPPYYAYAIIIWLNMLVGSMLRQALKQGTVGSNELQCGWMYGQAEELRWHLRRREKTTSPKQTLKSSLNLLVLLSLPKSIHERQKLPSLVSRKVLPNPHLSRFLLEAQLSFTEHSRSSFTEHSRSFQDGLTFAYSTA